MKLNKLSFLILSAMGISYASAGYAVTPEPIPEFTFSDESTRINDIKKSGNYTNADADVLADVSAGAGFTVEGYKYLTGIDINYSAAKKPNVIFKDDTHLIGTTIGHSTTHLGDSFRQTPFDNSSVIGITLKGIDAKHVANLQMYNGTTSYNTTVDAFGVMELRTASDTKQRVSAYNTRVNKDGKLTVGYNAYAENNLIDGGELTIPGGSPKNTAIIKNNIIRNGGTQIIYQGTAINNYITGQGSYQMASGLAENNYIYDGGYQMVYAGGDDDVAARNTTIYQSGTQRIKSGTAEDNLVYGTQIITSHQGDWKNGQWVSSEDPTETQGDTPTALNSTIVGSGEQIVSRMGNAENTLIDGGKQHVEEYAGIRNTTIRNSGSTVIDNGGYSFGKLNVENGSVTLKSGGKHYWTEDFSTGAYAQHIELMGSESLLYITPDDDTSESVATISTLKNNGVTIFGDISGNNHKRYSQLNIKELSGNGLFVMNTSLADGSGDFLSVSDKTDGKFGVRVMDSGKALVSNTTDPDRYHLIHAAGSQNDTFTMTNKSVDLGAYKYYLVQDKDSADEWYLSPTKETPPVDPVDPVDPKPEPKPEPELPDLSEPSKTAMMIANALPQIWRSELSTLRARLGELRNNPQVNLGVWSKVTGGRHNISNNEVAYRHDISGIVAGGDKMTELENGDLWSGIVAGYSHSSLKMDKNDGTINSYSLGVYTTWQHKSGIYVDGVVKANHFRSDYDASFNEGKTSASSNTNGIGFSVETGKYFEKENYFIEPYAMVAAFRGQGADYRYSNEMSIKADAARSFSGELGATFGKNFVLENGAQLKPYIRVAVNHEFLKNGDVALNKQGKRTNDMSGTTGKYGIGVDAKLNNNWAVYGEFNYANGSKQETPYSGFLGVNYRF
ncbi:autotransporter outer membrane beta-barrel domain-containing protein [Morganella morganii subsp. sibonii]|uniref:autotransporter outer membrane beta-barrel domain-containing protein n=1 Tax=Morganella morganii TaxID=582 RepID=UPI001BD45CC6|nr:autotransporter outer membrane beta-barrel domain-containing protein [Morganella morganii]MBS9542196.1 autotransporter outer membrane beta-barrel domain-containing protein [Morganella morganii subsp. morganii]